MEPSGADEATAYRRGRRQGVRRRITAGPRVMIACILGCFVLAVASTLWLGLKALTLKSEMQRVSDLAVNLKSQITQNDPDDALATVGELKVHSAAARQQVDDPLWAAASSMPWLGANFQAAREMTVSVDDVVHLGVAPLANVYQTLDWHNLLSKGDVVDLQPLANAAPDLLAASHTISASSERLDRIDEEPLLNQLRQPLVELKSQLSSAGKGVDIASNVAAIAPNMMGASGPRHYLLLVQNNAEVRATGGIPGALAVLEIDKGKMTLTGQSSASALGAVSPNVKVDAEQQNIYSSRLGKYMQDVNMTPDFPTAAATARKIWNLKTGQTVDGVVSIDPVALSYVLAGTGSVDLRGPETKDLAAAGLPVQLTSANVVPTLLSDVYAKIQSPEMQDAYFASVAKEIFSALGSGQGDTRGLLDGLTRAAQEDRINVWSASDNEESILQEYTLGGAITGPSVMPAEFGVYFNDGTGAKMDFYVKRTVQLIRECPADGYEQLMVRVTSTNTLNKQTAVKLPPYVTGGGVYGVPPGSVRTNIAVYGPVQAHIESTTVAGEKTPFAPYLHAERPVGVISQQLAPGESKTVDFTFGKIVQHTEPNVVVTPTVQPVKDVILPTENAACHQGQ